MKKVLFILSLFPSLSFAAGDVTIRQGPGGGSVIIQGGSSSDGNSGGGGATVNVTPTSVLFSTGGTTISGDAGFQYDDSVSSVTIAGDLQSYSVRTSTLVRGLDYTSQYSQPWLKSDQNSFGDFADININDTFNSFGYRLFNIYQYGIYAGSFGYSTQSGNGFYVMDSAGTQNAVIKTDGSIYGRSLNFSGGMHPPTPQRYTASTSIPDDTYFVQGNATSGAIIFTLPDLKSVSSPQIYKNEIRICKTDSSANTVTFAAGAFDSLDASVPTLSYQNDCVVLISSITNATDIGTWYSAMHSKPNAPTGSGGASTLAVGTGTASNFTNNITSPTAAISFLGSQFRSVASGTTNFISIDPSIIGGSGDMVLASTQTSTGAKRWDSYSNFIGSATFANLVAFNSSISAGQVAASSLLLNDPFVASTNTPSISLNVSVGDENWYSRQTFTNQNSATVLRSASCGLRSKNGEDPYFFVSDTDSETGFAIGDVLHVNVSTWSSSRGFVGINVSTPSARLSVGGHIQIASSTVTGPTLSGCGTSPSLVAPSYDGAGEITIGSGGVATSCTITFGQAWTNAPVCDAWHEGAILFIRPVTTTTSLVMDAATPLTAGGKLKYKCIGRE